MDFPYREVYPEKIAEFIAQLEERAGFPAPFSAAGVLAAASIAIGNSVHARRSATHTESPSLFICTVGKANTCKSHPTTLTLKPFFDKYKRKYQQYKLDKEAYDKWASMSKDKREASGMQEPTMPSFESPVLRDYSIDALLLALKENNRGIIVNADEWISVIKSLNKYQNGADLETLMSAWSGIDIPVSRKTSESFIVTSPCIVITGSVQTEILYKFFEADRDVNGACDRIVFVMPSDLKPTKWNPTEVDPELQQNYNAVIERLMEYDLPYDKYGNICPLVMDFAPEAMEIMLDWRNNRHYNDLLESEGETYGKAWGKLDIEFIRWALTLQCMYWASGEDSLEAIGVRAVRGAELMTNYFKQEARRVHQFVFEKDVKLLMTDIQRKLFEKLPLEFKVEEAVRIAEKIGMKFWSCRKFMYKTKFFKPVPGKVGYYRKNVKQ